MVTRRLSVLAGGLLSALRMGLVAMVLVMDCATAQSPEWKKIRVGVEGAYPPFSEVAPDGSLIGFDIDIANALCDQLHAQCTLVKQEFDGMIPALQARKFDAIIASMAITEQRKKVVLFTQRYFSTPSRFLTRTTNKWQATSVGLKGRRIGVQRSTTQDHFVTEIFRDSEIVRYAKQDDMYLDLAAGRVDLVLVDSVAGDVGFLKKPAGKGYGFFGPAFDDAAHFGEGTGIAVRKSDPELQRKFNEAILAIRANGIYKKIQDKYFDFDVYGSDRK